MAMRSGSDFAMPGFESLTQLIDLAWESIRQIQSLTDVGL